MLRRGMCCKHLLYNQLDYCQPNFCTQHPTRVSVHANTTLHPVPQQALVHAACTCKRLLHNQLDCCQPNFCTQHPTRVSVHANTTLHPVPQQALVHAACTCQHNSAPSATTGTGTCSLYHCLSTQSQDWQLVHAKTCTSYVHTHCRDREEIAPVHCEISYEACRCRCRCH